MALMVWWFMRKRNIRKRKFKRHKGIMVLSIIGILLLLSVGYGAFQSTLNVNVKGHIIPLASDLLKKNVVTSGSGLYRDVYEEGRFIFKGENPNNYICLSDEIPCLDDNLFRIISVENDGTIKVVKNDSIGLMAWDEAGNRDSSTSSYCSNSSNLGCNAWAATSHLVGNPVSVSLYYPYNNLNNYTNVYSGTVIKDASLNIFLNNTYYDSLNNKVKNLIQSKDWGVGSPGTEKIDDENISLDITQEYSYLWHGNIGLFSVTDVMRTTTDNLCNSLVVAFNNWTKSVCSNDNWLWTDENNWTISAGVLYHHGYMHCNDAKTANYVMPVFYLKTNIKLSGIGSLDKPYRVKQK